MWIRVILLLLSFAWLLTTKQFTFPPFPFPPLWSVTICFCFVQAPESQAKIYRKIVRFPPSVLFSQNLSEIGVFRGFSWGLIQHDCLSTSAPLNTGTVPSVICQLLFYLVHGHNGFFSRRGNMDISLFFFHQFLNKKRTFSESQNPVPFNELRSVSRVLHKRQADLGDVSECHPPRGRCQAPTAHCFFYDHIWPSKDQVPHLFCSFTLNLAV